MDGTAVEFSGAPESLQAALRETSLLQRTLDLRSSPWSAVTRHRFVTAYL